MMVGNEWWLWWTWEGAQGPYGGFEGGAEPFIEKERSTVGNSLLLCGR